MTFVPIRLAGDRITLKDGSHWTITEGFGRTGIDDYYGVENGTRSRFVYADEIASPAPEMRGTQMMGRYFRSPIPISPTLSEWTRRFDAARPTGPTIHEMVERGILPRPSYLRPRDEESGK